MKVLLINPVHSPTRKPCPNIGLTYISAALKAEGADVECWDLNRLTRNPTAAQMEADIASKEYDVAAIGAMIVCYHHVKELCEILKRVHPDREIWIGGSIVSPIPKLMLTDVPWVDVGVLNEGDQTVRELYQAKVAGDSYSKVRGIVYREQDGLHLTESRPYIENLDALPMPDWSIYKLHGQRGYFSTYEQPMFVMGNRGCPFNCTFCYHERSLRAHSAERLVAELQRSAEELGAMHVHIADNLYCADRTWVRKVCNRLIELDLGITWTASARSNTVDRETVRLMKAAGCTQIGMGFESASPRILKNIKKSHTPEQMSRALKIIRDEGVEPWVTFMIGNEGEDMASIAESVDFMKREMITAVLFLATPYPGTQLYESAKARGLIDDEIALFNRYGEQGMVLALNMTDFADNELIWLQKTAMRDIRRYYDKEHYKRVAREKLPDGAQRIAIIANGYEGENMVLAFQAMFEKEELARPQRVLVGVTAGDQVVHAADPRTPVHSYVDRLVLFSEDGPNGKTHYRGVPIRPLDELNADEFDAVFLADREITPATKAILIDQGMYLDAIHPYDDAYFLSKCL